jgi:hypothetical protein
MSQKYIGGFIGASTPNNYSVFFNSTSSFLAFAGASQYAIATSTTPFTIEFWINPLSSGGIVFTEQFSGAGDTLSITCSLCTGTSVDAPTGLFPAFGWYNGAAWTTAAVSTTAIVTNVWSHVALVFTGSTSRVYINGVDRTKASTPTPATTWGMTGDSGDGWYIGRNWQTVTNLINGNISNLRFVNGTAVYTGNFTPQPKLTAIPNTVLLTCQSPTFIDNSTYAVTITNTAALISSQNPSPATTPSLYASQLGAATNGVWTLNQAASATAQRSWNMFDPEFNLTTGMFHGNGTNGATNNTFLDSSTNNVAVTRNGNTTQGTFTPFSKSAKYWSNYFDGTGDYLSVANDAALQFGTGNFTVEFFANIQAAPGTFRFCVSKGGTSTGWAIYVDNTVGYWSFSETANSYVSPIRCLFNQWTHVALVRSSTSMVLYIDGVAGVSLVSSTNFNQTEALLIGLARNLTAPILGNISNLRILKGTALYLGPFTPPTEPLEKIANTSLLTCMNNRLVDNSDYAFPITRNGDVATAELSPFFTSAYIPEVNGGAMYFDGTGDYLTVADNPLLELGNSNFCVELLIYTTSAVTDAILITKRASSADYAPILIWRNAAVIRVALSSTGSSWDIADNISLGTIATNQWYHISVYRVGTAIYGSLNGTITTLNASTSASLLDNSAAYHIGSDSNLSPYVGYISNLRMVIGSSVYSSSSAPIPTAPLTPIPNTQLLLSGTNAAVFDNASTLTAETVNTSVSTAQSKYGGSSIAFNGTNAYVRLHTMFGAGNLVVPKLGNFTIEAWINPTTVNAARTIFYISGNTSSIAAVRLDHTNTGALQLLVSSTGTDWAINNTSTRLLTAGAWTHIAVVRAGIYVAVYLNGVLAAAGNLSAINTSLYFIATGNSLLGALISTSLTQFFSGYMSDFRVTNYARYMGGFTPPTSTLQNQ